METINKPKTRLSLAIVLSMLLVATLSSCAPAKLDVSNVSAIIDTRTPEEFAKSHIVGAINISYAAGSYLAYASSLAHNGVYYVYGETADEAGNAKADMVSLGINQVTNLGNFSDAQNVLPLGVTK